MIQVDRNTRIKDISKLVNENNPSFSGIVSRECKGRLWVDSMEEPRIALTESYAAGSFAFLGTYETKKDLMKLKTFLEEELFCDLRKEGYRDFEFSIESENIDISLLEIFKDKSIQTEREYHFRIHIIPNNNQEIPKGYQLRKVDVSFWNMLLEGNFENEDLLKTRLLESWYSFEEFMNKSIGYCVTLENRIVAVIVGTASFHNVISIDIETEKEHRRKGLAYAMTVEFISNCLRNEFTPQWDCVESNSNSYNMAKKLGFEKTGENTVYWFGI